MHFFKPQGRGGETKSKPEKISPEQGFTRSIARSLTLEDARGIHAIKYRYKRRRKNSSLNVVCHFKQNRGYRLIQVHVKFIFADQFSEVPSILYSIKPIV